MSRLKLPSVVLACIDGSAALPLTEFVIRECQGKIEFNDTLLLSNDVPKHFDGTWMQFLTGGIDAAMKILWYDLPPLIDDGNVSHILHAHWDAGILDIQEWTDEFLEYDYIGAPWGWHNDKYEVGNGGFSLRSIRLMKHVAMNEHIYPFKNPEDDMLCRQYRPKLEAAGFKWAPLELASKFSVERSRVPGVSKHFGFHGIFNWLPHLNETALLERVALINDYVESRPEYREVKQQFLGLKPFAKSTMLPVNFPPS